MLACSSALSLLPDLGCDKTRPRVTLQEWNDPLDHDLEAQLIYRHLLGVEAELRYAPGGGRSRDLGSGLLHGGWSLPF